MLLRKVEEVLPPSYQKWAKPALHHLTHLFAISVAFFLSKTISAIQSALLGGVMAVQALLVLAKSHQLVDGAFDPEKTNVDEAAAYVLAFFGVWWQISHGFGVPFPLNLVTWPISIVETLLASIVGVSA